MSQPNSTIAEDSQGAFEKAPLPGGWRWVRLGDVSDVISKGTTPTSLGYAFTSSGVPFLRAEDVNGGAVDVTQVAYHVSDETHRVLSRSQLSSGDLLITIAGTLGRVGYVPKDSPPLNCNQAVAFARLKPQLVDVEYACFVCRSEQVLRPLTNLSAGGIIQNLNLQQVQSLSIPLPPLPEQKRIAAILKEQMAAVERARAAAEAQLKAAKKLPAAYLRAVFDDAEARGWQIAKVGDISALIIDGPHVTPTYAPKGVPFVTVKNIVNRRVDLSQVSYITDSDHALFTRRGKAERGDILYTKDGTLGIPCVVDIDQEFSFFVSVALIKLMRERADSRFVAYALESPLVLKQVERLGAGAGLKHMVLRSIRALEIPLPSMPEQRKIAGALDEQMLKAEQTKKTLQDQLESINKLPSALLRQAFIGKL